MAEKKQHSSIWLVIILCGIIFFLGWIVLRNRYYQQVNLLNQQMQTLEKKVDQTTQTKENKIKQLEEKIEDLSLTPTPQPTASATPNISKSSPTPN